MRLGTMLLAAALVATITTLAHPEERQPPAGPASGPSARPHHRRSHEQGRFFHSLTVEQQERFLKLLDEWSNLSSEQREEILSRFEQYKDLAPEERDRLRRGLERFERMSPDQRERMREHMQQWQQMPPEERRKFRARTEEMRRRAEQDLAKRLDDLGLAPGPEQMRWIRRYYFEKRREVEQQAFRRARELKAQLPADASEQDRTRIREEVQQYRREIEERTFQDFAEYARNPHPLPPPGEARGEPPFPRDHTKTRRPHADDTP